MWRHRVNPFKIYLSRKIGDCEETIAVVFKKEPTVRAARSKRKRLTDMMESGGPLTIKRWAAGQSNVLIEEP